MKKAKKYYQKKGAIIGLLVGLVITFINLFNPFEIEAIHSLSGLLISPISFLVFRFGLFDNNSLGFLLIIIPIYALLIVFYGLIGFIIGYLIEKKEVKNLIKLTKKSRTQP